MQIEEQEPRHYGTIALVLFCASVMLSFALAKTVDERNSWKHVAGELDEMVVRAGEKYDSLKTAGENHLDSSCKVIQTIKTNKNGK